LKLNLTPSGIIPTGNEYVSLPTIRANDAALENFNVLSFKHKGLLECAAPKDQPLLQPQVTLNGQTLALSGFSWDLLGFWIPVGSVSVGGLEIKVTYCSPQDGRCSFVRLQARNKKGAAVKLRLGLKVQWTALNRVIYASAPIRGERSFDKAPWVEQGVVFKHRSDDTLFAWCLRCPGGTWTAKNVTDGVNAEIGKDFDAAAGSDSEACFYLGVGPEEFSASNSAKNVSDHADRQGVDDFIRETADWCLARCRKTSKPELDELMNRNFLFNRFYSWGRTVDTEQLVSVTSRSPRYYVCAAYWDRDAMIWSFPALLDCDPEFAREALDHALTLQLRNTGRHSRFIDGTVLEDGYQLDEGAAPIVALRDYLKATGDKQFLKDHERAVDELERMLMTHYDKGTGLFTTHEDSQDNYTPEIFFTYAIVYTWHALLALAEVRTMQGRKPAAAKLKAQAASVKKSVLKNLVAKGAPGATGTTFAKGAIGSLKSRSFEDVPPGSLVKLPALGFVPENDPVFTRTWDWLHSDHNPYSNNKKAYGLPASWRVAFTGCWVVADHLRLKRGQANALRILAKATWDSGIVSEGLDPETAEGVGGGSAFATAAGYVSHAIWDVFGQKGKKK
jgi:hypothetical protein